MNNIVSNFSQIVEFAQKQGMPVIKKRAILREYLQSKFVAYLYSSSRSGKLVFVGGTSLRLLRDIDRFSEDLDFDNLDLSKSEIYGLIEVVVKKFEQENIDVKLYTKVKEHKTYFEVKFPTLLSQLNISANPREILMIKVDYSGLWKGQSREVILFNKYGFMENVVTNTVDHLLVQKLVSYVKRKMTQPRDLYDIVWLFSKGARLDKEFMKANSFDSILVEAKQKMREEGLSGNFKARLKPFLFIEGNIGKLDLFESVLEKL